MQLKDFARGVPDDVWAVFEPTLPPKVWQGNGRTPIGNRECLHGLLYVLASGIAWDMLPPGFPSAKTIKRRLKVWLRLDVFLHAWEQLAQRYQRLHGINWDQVLMDGSKKPSKKGGPRPALRPSIAASAAPPCT